MSNRPFPSDGIPLRGAYWHFTTPEEEKRHEEGRRLCQGHDDALSSLRAKDEALITDQDRANLQSAKPDWERGLKTMADVYGRVRRELENRLRSGELVIKGFKVPLAGNDERVTLAPALLPEVTLDYRESKVSGVGLELIQCRVFASCSKTDHDTQDADVVSAELETMADEFGRSDDTGPSGGKAAADGPAPPDATHSTIAAEARCEAWFISLMADNSKRDYENRQRELEDAWPQAEAPEFVTPIRYTVFNTPIIRDA